METNCSWSIDDSRNKFQFGCERGHLIENGKLGAVVKNPNYRGISASFWRSLARGRQRRHDAGAGHAVLRQGRAGPGDPRRPRVAGVRVPRRRRFRWERASMAPRDNAAPAATMESYFHDVAATLDGLVQAGEAYTACVRRRMLRFRPHEPRQGAPARQRRPALPRLDLIRGARHAIAALSLTGDPGRTELPLATAWRPARRAAPMPRTTRTSSSRPRCTRRARRAAARCRAAEDDRRRGRSSCARARI